jgi:hypothetical protein
MSEQVVIMSDPEESPSLSPITISSAPSDMILTAPQYATYNLCHMLESMGQPVLTITTDGRILYDSEKKDAAAREFVDFVNGLMGRNGQNIAPAHHVRVHLCFSFSGDTARMAPGLEIRATNPHSYRDFARLLDLVDKGEVTVSRKGDSLFVQPKT